MWRSADKDAAYSSMSPANYPKNTWLQKADEFQTELPLFCSAWRNTTWATRIVANGVAYARADQIRPSRSFDRMGKEAPQGSSDFNLSMWVYDGQDIVSNFVKQDGLWEPLETVEVIKKLVFFEKATKLKKSDVYLIDIGANVGWFTVNAASMGYSVIAFEPASSNAFAIKRTLCGAPLLQRHVTLVDLGLGDKFNRCNIVAASHNIGDGHAECTNMDYSGIPGMIVIGQFNITTLDAFFAPNMFMLQDKVGVLKIDVESFEDEIFLGARRFMEVVRPMFVLAEFHPKFSKGTTAEELLIMFDGWGYSVHIGGFDGPHEPRTGFNTLADRAGDITFNLFFVHKNATTASFI